MLDELQQLWDVAFAAGKREERGGRENCDHTRHGTEVHVHVAQLTLAWRDWPSPQAAVSRNRNEKRAGDSL